MSTFAFFFFFVVVFVVVVLHWAHYESVSKLGSAEAGVRGGGVDRVAP